jgi:hypothetical protein
MPRETSIMSAVVHAGSRPPASAPCRSCGCRRSWLGSRPTAWTRWFLKLCNGSDAVETALKIAMVHTGRRRVACLPGARHGESFLTLGLASTHRGRLLADPDRAVIARTPDIAALTRLVAGRRDLASTP